MVSRLFSRRRRRGLTNLHNLKGLDSAGMRDVRTTTEVNQRSTTIHRRTRAIGNLVLDQMLLVLVVPEHLQEIDLGEDEAVEGLLVLDDLAGDGLQWLPIRILHHSAGGRKRGKQRESATMLFFDLEEVRASILIGKGHFIIETVIDWGSDAQMTSEPTFGRFTQDVGARMPEDFFA